MVQIMQTNCRGYARKLQELKEARKTDLRCSALAGQSPCPYVLICYHCCDLKFEILLDPPYSPDMAPSGFYLFQKMKSHLRGSQYGSNECAIEQLTSTCGTRKRPFILKG